MTARRGIPRRDFCKTAVAIGGGAALAACTDRGESIDVEQGRLNLSTLPERQHAWNEFLARDEVGNVVQPRHHVLLLLQLQSQNDSTTGAASTRPTDTEREQVEQAFRGLERAYERGNGGLVFTVGYSPRYFDRYDASLPESVELPEPEALAPFESPKLDRPDAIVQLASDHAQVVLAAEEGLRGRRDTLNGLKLDASLTDVFEVGSRRTGFVGEGLPADNDGEDVVGVPDDDVPDDAPMYMGFKSGFEHNQATEDRVTIGDGAFAGGTTQHASLIRLRLQQWYEQDSRYHREATMFCPVHAEEGLVEGTGENLGTSTEITEQGCPADAEEHAREHGVVGHSQKAARAREDGSPIILRRDFDSTDGGRASLHFVSLQRSIDDFVDTRQQMNGTELTESGAVGQRVNNGILQYMTVERRGNYLLPPRSLRSLPRPDPA